MAIGASDLQWWIPGSDGKISYLARTNSANNLFPNVTGAQNRDGMIDYRQIIFLNASAQTLSAAKIYFKAIMSGGVNLSFALDPLGVVAASARAVDPSTPPAPSAYVAPTTVAGALTIPNLGASQCIGIWVRRQAFGGAALTPERTTLTIFGTTPA